MSSKYGTILVPLIVTAFLVVGCEHSGGGSARDLPVFTDGNENGINDMVEVGTHFVDPDDPSRHDFQDNNGDQICDLAQQPEPLWHGPGYIDTDGDGICDYWDRDSSRHQEGRRDIVHGADFSEAEHGGGPHH